MEYIYMFIAFYAAGVLSNETNKFLVNRGMTTRDWFIKKIKRPVRRFFRKIKRKINLVFGIVI